MACIITLTPGGAKIGIDEHKSNINKLKLERDSINKKSKKSGKDLKRLSCINSEIGYRQKQLKKLEDFLKQNPS